MLIPVECKSLTNDHAKALILELSLLVMMAKTEANGVTSKTIKEAINDCDSDDLKYYCYYPLIENISENDFNILKESAALADPNQDDLLNYFNNYLINLDRTEYYSDGKSFFTINGIIEVIYPAFVVHYLCESNKSKYPRNIASGLTEINSFESLFSIFSRLESFSPKDLSPTLSEEEAVRLFTKAQSTFFDHIDNRQDFLKVVSSLIISIKLDKFSIDNEDNPRILLDNRDKKVILCWIIINTLLSGDIEDTQLFLISNICDTLNIDKEYIDEFIALLQSSSINTRKELSELINE